MMGLIAFIIGFFVTLLEAVCTGQIYLPTITFIIKTPQKISFLLLLAWYNFIFVLPLLIIIILHQYGIENKKINFLLKNNIILVKILQLLFFLFLAIIFWHT